MKTGKNFRSQTTTRDQMAGSEEAGGISLRLGIGLAVFTDRTAGAV